MKNYRNVLFGTLGKINREMTKFAEVIIAEVSFSIVMSLKLLGDITLRIRAGKLTC